MPKQTSEKTEPKPRKFDPASLTQEQRDQVVELEFGVHPQYMNFTYNEIQVDLWRLEHAGGRFDGFRQWLKQMGKV